MCSSIMWLCPSFIIGQVILHLLKSGWVLWPPWPRQHGGGNTAPSPGAALNWPGNFHLEASCHAEVKLPWDHRTMRGPGQEEMPRKTRSHMKKERSQGAPRHQTHEWRSRAQPDISVTPAPTSIWWQPHERPEVRATLLSPGNPHKLLFQPPKLWGGLLLSIDNPDTERDIYPGVFQPQSINNNNNYGK